MRVRLLLHAALLGVVALATAAPAQASWDVNWTTYTYTADDTYAAMEQHSLVAQCIVTAEVGGGWYGGPPFDPYSVGQAGELGVAQLHPRGKLPEFYALGYTNPYSPYQSMDYLEEALERGEGPAWTTYWYCV
jgi:hypothetical protein